MPFRESDRLIVAKKQLITAERRGLAEVMQCKKKGEPIGNKTSYYGRSGRKFLCCEVSVLERVRDDRGYTAESLQSETEA